MNQTYRAFKLFIMKYNNFDNLFMIIADQVKYG